MLIQLFVGSAVSALNIILHACVTVLAMGAARSAARRTSLRPLLYLAGVMVATSLALMAAHTLEVFVWSVAYAIVNAAPMMRTWSISRSSITPLWAMAT